MSRWAWWGVGRPGTHLLAAVRRLCRPVEPLRLSGVVGAVAGLLGGLWAASAAASAPLVAQDLVVRGGEVRTVSGAIHAPGTVVIRDGRIVAVGPDEVVDPPGDLEVLDATGLVVTPGFIDARTSLGLTSAGAFERDRLVRGPVRVAEHLEEPEIPGVFGMEGRQTAVHPWLADGVTTVYVAPAPLNLVAGFGAVVKLRRGGFGAVVDSAAALHLSLGEGPLRAFDAPTTRQGMVAVLRRWLAAVDAGIRGEPLPAERAPERVAAPVPDPVSDELRAVLDGRRPVRVHAHAPDDIVTGIRVAREFGLRGVLDGATGAHRVVEALAEADFGVVVGPSMVGAGGGGAPERFAHTAENAYRLHLGGVPIALSTDGERGRSVTTEAVVARGHGLPAEAALRALTLDAARVLGVDDRLGSIEVGKDGDLVLWRGDPVGTWGRTQVVVVDGEVVWRR